MISFSLDWTELSLQTIITLAHFLWQACVVGAMWFALQQMADSFGGSQFPRRKSRNGQKYGKISSANNRYLFACLAFFSFPICALVTFVSVHQSRGTIFIAANEPSKIASDPVVTESEFSDSGKVTTKGTLPTLDEPAIAGMPTVEQGVPDLEPSVSPKLEMAPAFWFLGIQALAPHLVIAYAIGVSLMLARFCLSIASCARLRRTIQPIVDSTVLKSIAEQATRLGLKRVPVVALCPRVSVPVVVGILKPTILLPVALMCGLDPYQLAAILSHEMAHIRRYDLIVNLLQRIVEALFFFHPVTWWMSRRVSIERENCCDDVAADCIGRLSYAGALLQMAELCMGHESRKVAVLTTLSADGGNSSDLGFRIRRLIGAEETIRMEWPRRRLATGLALASVLVVSLVAWGGNRRTEDEISEDGVGAKIFTPEPLWQIELAADDGASEMVRMSPVITAGNRVLSIKRDFVLGSGKPIEKGFPRISRKNDLDVALDPVYRRKSSDREFIVEVSVHGLDPRSFTLPSSEIRVFRAIDGSQVGMTIHLDHFFDGNTSDVDVENGGGFVLVGTRSDVSIYRSETGKIETTLPLKPKRVDAVAFCPDYKRIVVSDQNELHFWRWRDQAVVETVQAGRKIDSLVFTPDGQYLAEGPDTREDIQVRDMRSLLIIASLKDEVGSPLMVSSMDITPDGRYLVAHNEASVDPTKLTIAHRIHVWDLKTRGKPVYQIATGEWVRSVSFSDDSHMIVGEFSGAAHGSLLAAWRLPDNLIHRQVDSSSEAKDRLGDGIQWSRWGDRDGLLSGARLILPKDGLKPGQPLIVEYRLANVSREAKSLKCYLNNGSQLFSLSQGNRIGGSGLDWHREPNLLTIKPGEAFVDSTHLVTIDTKGLQAGVYQVALGSAFRYPDSMEPNTIQEIPHRGSMKFELVGEFADNVKELPPSDIQWGKPVSGLQVGARLVGNAKSIAIGEAIEADLFIANVTDQPIECSVATPHVSHGWLFEVIDSNGDAVMLEWPDLPIFSPHEEDRVIPFRLAPGEIAPITVAGEALRRRPTLETDHKRLGSLPWLDTEGGAYSISYLVTARRPDIPSLRLEFVSGSVEFSVGPIESNPDVSGGSDSAEAGTFTPQVLDLKDNEVASFVDKTLSTPYQPDPAGGSWQLGAHNYQILATLALISQQELVADILLKKLEMPDGTMNILSRKLALDYCAQRFPDRLIPYLIGRVSATKFPELDMSVIGGQSLPSYDEINVLGDIGEQAKGAIPALTKHLSAGNPIVREATIRALTRIGPSDPEVMQSLTKCFNDKNERVQSTAVYEAGRYGKLALPLGPKFVELLATEEKEVQYWAAAALITSEFNSELGFEKLLAGAKTGTKKDRLQALIGLAMLGNRAESVLPELRVMLNDSDAEVVREVNETIRRIEANDRIITHAEEAVQKAAARERVALATREVVSGSSKGGLQGRITLEGVVPKIPKIRVPTPSSPRLGMRATDEQRKDFEASLVEIDDESFQVDDDHGLANAFVYMAKAPTNWQPSPGALKPVTLSMQDYRFEPRAVLVRKGQDVLLSNSGIQGDNFAFEPRSNGGQNRIVDAGAEVILQQPFTTAELVPVQAKSQMNNWKSTYLLPLDHPFAAITDKHGRFSIEGLPPGEHTFFVWHERVGWLEKSLVVNIEADRLTEVNRSFSVDRFRLVAKPNDAHDTPIDIAWGEPVDGMRLGIRLSEFARRRSPLRHGEHIEYEVWIKNDTNEIVKIARDPRDTYSPRLMDDQSINVVGGGMRLSFGLPQGELEKAELILLPGQAAIRFTQSYHSASIRPPGSPRGRFGPEPLLLEPGKYPVYAQLDELKSGVEEVAIIPAAGLQLRKASKVTEKMREYASQDPSEAILSWQSAQGETLEAMVNWDHGIMIDERDLAAVEVKPVDGSPEQFAVLIQLKAESASWLARRIKSYTLWEDPDMVAILLDGKTLAVSRLTESMSTEKLLIGERFTRKEADEIALRLRSLKNANWVTAPQICLGRAYSNSAKAANWKWDDQQRASLATPDSGEILVSTLPGADADFVVTVKAKLLDGAQCRLTIGDATFDISKNGGLTRLVTADKEHTFPIDDNADEWTLLRVQRRDNLLLVQVDERPQVELGEVGIAIEKIILKSRHGTVAVSNFMVTGDLQRAD